MKFNIETLRDHPLVKYFARLLNHCTVVLSSGMEVYFDRNSSSVIYDNPEPLSDTETKEYILAMELMGI